VLGVSRGQGEEGRPKVRGRGGVARYPNVEYGPLVLGPEGVKKMMLSMGNIHRRNGKGRWGRGERDALNR